MIIVIVKLHVSVMMYVTSVSVPLVLLLKHIHDKILSRGNVPTAY